MSQPPTSLDNKTLSRMIAAGAALGALGIVLFVGMWVVLGSLDADVTLRLFASLCVPPAVIAAIVVGYMFLNAGKHPTS